MTTQLDTLFGRIDARRREVAVALAEAGPDLDLSRVKSVPGGRDAVLDWLRAANVELEVLGRSAENLRKSAGDSRVPTPRDGGPTVGERFVKSSAFRDRVRGQAGPESTLDVDVKTLMTSTGGFPVDPTRSGLVVESAQRQVSVLDYIPRVETRSAKDYGFVEETTFTNSAAEVAEAGTYPEAAFVLTDRTSPIGKIGTWLPVTDEQLEDEPGARDFLDARLGFMVRQRLDGQVVVGNGTAPNLRGMLNVSGTLTQAKGADTTLDACFKATTKVRVTGRANPGVVIFHPTNWEAIRLLKDSAGAYLLGSPSSPGPDFLWGQRVTQTDAMTLGTAVSGDLAGYTLLAVRRDVTVQVTNSHAGHFVEGKQAVRATVRAAFVVLRPAALCTITGL